MAVMNVVGTLLRAVNLQRRLFLSLVNSSNIRGKCYLVRACGPNLVLLGRRA